MFVDRADIIAEGGRGGDGCCAFLREKYRPFGGPAGGDGGRGGSVILRATGSVSTLAEIHRQVHFRAESGRPGSGNRRAGRAGRDLVVAVPLGTLVRAWRPDGTLGPVLRDLVAEGEEFVAARGGRGGRGNAAFATPTDQAPRRCERGEPGSRARYTLELKLIADVGLVGLPNAGKSTLLRRLSAARPKVAPYPFTTLAPVLGVVELGEYRQCVFADIPGLIEGAHQGAGLGHAFLRHIERTRLLVHVIDAAPAAGDPVAAYRQVRHELQAHGAGLAERPELVALNKVDLPESAAGIAAFRAAHPELEVYPISAATGAGIGPLLAAVARRLQALSGSGRPAPSRP
ncbi:MAG: hypothetical protein KatS3mg102_1772 [Planctomycetota bacterium]|nr:MAG: hypothetical protein KatS3mg102_1772 [Planctomycetota bacterium]